MTAPNLDALAALIDKATPGPWRVRETTESQYQPRVLQAKYVMAALEDYDRSRTDADLIVAAVNALPALLAYVRELESLVERMARSDSNVAIAMRERCAQLLNITRSDAQLMAGDMTAGEWRTVSAVLRNRAAAIRALEG